MLSRSTLNNGINTFFRYAIACGKFFARRLTGGACHSDFGNFSIGNLSVSMAITSANLFGMLLHPMTAFLRHVSRILFVSALPKVKRVTAKAIIASVADRKRVVGLFMSQEVCDAMSKHDYLSDAIDAVSMFAFASGPHPTISIRAIPRSLINLVPKSFLFLRGKRGNDTIALSHDSFPPSKSFVVRADKCVNTCSARFAL